VHGLCYCVSTAILVGRGQAKGIAGGEGGHGVKHSHFQNLLIVLQWWSEKNKFTLSRCLWKRNLRISGRYLPKLTIVPLIKVKVKLSLCCNGAPRHEGVLVVWMYSSTHSLTSALDGDVGCASSPGRFTPRERAPGTHWIGGWFDCRLGLGIFLYTTAYSTALEPTQPLIQWVPGALFLGVKRSVHEADQLPPSSAEVEERVELYLHSPNTLSWRGA
jgi:hypothetical protein